ncbi:hypothetical protein [Streptomyces sp. NPDC059452]|uniref:hypothetical protein n=1 Tax=Streptomyces sp. NPDC059452 TaxID=3346835 RepID=UPI00369872E5
MPGVADIGIDLMDGGHLLERLLEPGDEGRQWFFFQQRALGLERLRERQRVAEDIAHDRYTPGVMWRCRSRQLLTATCQAG